MPDPVTIRLPADALPDDLPGSVSHKAATEPGATSAFANGNSAPEAHALGMPPLTSLQATPVKLASRMGSARNAQDRDDGSMPGSPISQSGMLQDVWCTRKQ